MNSIVYLMIWSAVQVQPTQTTFEFRNAETGDLIAGVRAIIEESGTRDDLDVIESDNNGKAISTRIGLGIKEINVFPKVLGYSDRPFWNVHIPTNTRVVRIKLTATTEPRPPLPSSNQCRVLPLYIPIAPYCDPCSGASVWQSYTQGFYPAIPWTVPAPCYNWGPFGNHYYRQRRILRSTPGYRQFVAPSREMWPSRSIRNTPRQRFTAPQAVPVFPSMTGR